MGAQAYSTTYNNSFPCMEATYSYAVRTQQKGAFHCVFIA